MSESYSLNTLSSDVLHTIIQSFDYPQIFKLIATGDCRIRNHVYGNAVDKLRICLPFVTEYYENSDKSSSATFLKPFRNILHLEWLYGTPGYLEMPSHILNRIKSLRIKSGAESSNAFAVLASLPNMKSLESLTLELTDNPIHIAINSYSFPESVVSTLRHLKVTRYFEYDLSMLPTYLTSFEGRGDIKRISNNEEDPLFAAIPPFPKYLEKIVFIYSSIFEIDAFCNALPSSLLYLSVSGYSKVDQSVSHYLPASLKYLNLDLSVHLSTGTNGVIDISSLPNLESLLGNYQPYDPTSTSLPSNLKYINYKLGFERERWPNIGLFDNKELRIENVHFNPPSAYCIPLPEDVAFYDSALSFKGRICSFQLHSQLSLANCKKLDIELVCEANLFSALLLPSSLLTIDISVTGRFAQNELDWLIDPSYINICSLFDILPKSLTSFSADGWMKNCDILEVDMASLLPNLRKFSFSSRSRPQGISKPYFNPSTLPHQLKYIHLHRMFVDVRRLFAILPSTMSYCSIVLCSIIITRDEEPISGNNNIGSISRRGWHLLIDCIDKDRFYDNHSISLDKLGRSICAFNRHLRKVQIGFIDVTGDDASLCFEQTFNKGRE